MNTEHAQVNMLTQQLRAWEVLDQLVLDVIASTPRDQFVPAPYRNLAFADMNIPLDHGQVMLTPKEEARIIQALKIQSSERILEIGTGSGYMTALLAKLGQHVHSVDIFPEFVQNAQTKFVAMDIENVSVTAVDAVQAWSPKELYDIIVITGSLPYLLENFRQSLKIGGRLFAILGQAPVMKATLLTRVAQGKWPELKLFETMVPPLLNAPTPSAFVF